MPLRRLLLNILWIVTGGIWMAAGWLLAAVIMAITIIGLPWAGGVQHRALHSAAVWAASGVSRRIHRVRRYRHRPARRPRQYHLAHPRRVVAGARPPDHGDRLGDHAHRPALRLGASEAGRHRP